MPNVITITGPSAAGKSTMARFLLTHADQAFKPQLVPKYTTRPRRLDDRGEVCCVESIPLHCDLVYEHYEHRYGLELQAIVDALDQGYSPVVILNDVRIVKQVRRALGPAVHSCFIFRERPLLERYQELARSLGVTDEKEPVRRFLYAQAFYHVYGANIHIFERVIVNSGTLDDLYVQVLRLAQGLARGTQSVPDRERLAAPGPRFFVLVDLLGTAQDALLRAVRSLGPRQARAISQSTLYDTDGGSIPGSEGGGEVPRTDEISRALQEGVSPVVVVNDIERAHRLCECFPLEAVLAYVHSEERVRGYPRLVHSLEADVLQPEQWKARYRAAFEVYLAHMLAFDHVIIHSGDAVNLLDQLFWLLRAYERGDLPRAPAQLASFSEATERLVSIDASVD